MALRTRAPHDPPGWHAKPSVDVQMTSAVRPVPPAAVRNGPVVSALLADLGSRAGIGVLREVAAGAVLVDGQPCRSLAMGRRAGPVPPKEAARPPPAPPRAPPPPPARPPPTRGGAPGYPAP